MECTDVLVDNKKMYKQMIYGTVELHRATIEEDILKNYLEYDMSYINSISAMKLAQQ